MAKEFKLPDLGEGVESATVGTVLVSVGDALTGGTVVMDVESEKATLPVACPYSGKVAAIHVKPGDPLKAGTLVLTVEEGATAGATPNGSPSAPAKEAAKPASAPAAAPTSAKPAPASAPAVATIVRTGPIPAAPATRRLARELGVDLHTVPGTAPGGRITREDVKAFFARQSGGGGRGPVIPPLPDFTQFGPVKRTALNAVAKASARNLSLSWQVVPHVTQHELADVTELESARKEYVKARPSAPKITMTVLAMKAVVAALKDFPNFNASFDADAQEVIVKQYYNIGIAVDTEHGLMVPVVRDVDKKSLNQLAAEVGEIAEKARTRKLDMAQLKGGTFTISNLGGLGGTAFTPIVNYPEVAILGMARSRQEYTLVNGKPEFRLMLPLSLSYDHRVVNGADGARFVTKLASLLTSPFALMAE
jgi:pyruvate dehydrogenase E2 component (dihydrolipoamide acetyltransferase)